METECIFNGKSTGRRSTDDVTVERVRQAYLTGPSKSANCASEHGLANSVKTTSSASWQTAIFARLEAWWQTQEV